MGGRAAAVSCQQCDEDISGRYRLFLAEIKNSEVVIGGFVLWLQFDDPLQFILGAAQLGGI